MDRQTYSKLMHVTICILYIISSLRTDHTQICFTLHFTPLDINFSLLVNQPFAFSVLETINLGHNLTNC